MTSLLKALVTAATVVSFSNSGVFANLLKRTDGPTSPPCAVPFTPYLYAGCYTDTHSPRALKFSPEGLDRQNMTVQKCVAVCKGNNFRYAGIEYYGECYCGDSIMGNPAADDACTFPCTGNKSETCGGNNLVSVYMDPTYPTSDSTTVADYTAEGCYTEGYNGRAVAFRQDQLSTSNLTTEICLQACKSQNFPLAATEYSSECYCGVVLGNGTAAAPSRDCQMPCSGDHTEFCGGRSRLNLYIANDLMSTEPCNPFVLPPPIVSSSTSSLTTSTSSTTSSSVSTTDTSSSPSLTQSSTSTTEATTSTPAATTQAAHTTTETSQTSTTSSSLTSTESSSTTATATTSTSTSTTSTSTTSTSTTSTSTTSTSTTSTSTTSTSTTSTSTTSTSTTSTSTSTSTTSTSTSTSTTTPYTSTTKTSTSTTSSTTKCVTTAPAPTCEFGCGKWCSKPLPVFSDNPSCKIAVAECVLQIADCFLTAGWPASLQCVKYQSWCSAIGTYCSNTCVGKKCSKVDCISQNPPVGGSTTTSTGLCTATSTTTTAPSTSVVPVPTATSICILPKGGTNSGYSNGGCVGGIQPPILTCNNIAQDFGSFPLKLYTSKDSKKCQGYPRNTVPQACKDACLVQYNTCMDTYATGCKGYSQSSTQDSYDSAKTKCQNQYKDCLAVNSQASAGNRCMSFGSGWS